MKWNLQFWWTVFQVCSALVYLCVCRPERNWIMHWIIENIFIVKQSDKSLMKKSTISPAHRILYPLACTHSYPLSSLPLVTGMANHDLYRSSIWMPSTMCTHNLIQVFIGGKYAVSISEIRYNKDKWWSVDISAIVACVYRMLLLKHHCHTVFLPSVIILLSTSIFSIRCHPVKLCNIQAVACGWPHKYTHAHTTHTHWPTVHTVSDCCFRRLWLLMKRAAWWTLVSVWERKKGKVQKNGQNATGRLPKH